MAISVDGPDAQSHDDFRGIPGTFDRAMMALYHAKKIGLETQFQTTVTRRNMARLPEVAKIAEDVGTKMWSLFFLIVTGRALENDDLAAERIRAGFRVHVRTVEDRAVRHQDHRGDALPPLRGAAHEGGASLHAGERKDRRRDVAHGGRQRRQGFRVRLAHRRDLSQRLPAG